MKTATAKTEPAGYAQPKTIETPINELHLAAEAPKGVNLVVRDSGSGSPMTDEELKASIYNNGALVPLIYKRHDGKKYVIAGNRRLRMLRQIYSDALTSTVPAQDVDDFGDVNWRQVAIDTNLSLPPHAVERYEQIVLLSKDLKLSPEDARSRFGLTPRQFDQVMALGKMAPIVREAWKQGAIDARTAQVFTIEPDPKEQEKIFNRAVKEAHNGRISDWDVRRRIVPQNAQELGKLVAFVGVDVCKKAKVIKQEDLFGSNHVVSDAKALNKLVGDKMVTMKDMLLKTGWSWVLTENELGQSEWQYGTLTPAQKSKPTKDQEAELEQLRKAEQDDDSDFDDIHEQIEAIDEAVKQAGFTDTQRKKAGCILKILNDGKLSISYGRTKPEEKRATAAANAGTAKPKAKAAKPGAPPALTNALAERLSIQLETALRDVMKKTPRASVAALIAAIASGGEVVDISVGGRASTYEERSKRKSSFTSVFEGALKSQPEAQLAMLMGIAAEALSIKTFSAERDPLKDAGLLAMIAALPALDVSKALRDGFDAKDYFAGVPLASTVDAVRCAINDGAAAEVAKMKKSAAAEYAAKHVPTTGWLPPRLRTVHYSGPTESTAKKATPAKKAKPAKKSAKKKAKR